MDRDKLGHLTTLTSLSNAMSPEMVVWVVEYVQEERILEFFWHRVARKRLVVERVLVNTMALASVWILHLLGHHRLTLVFGC
jgi:hypothetical protein